MAGLHAFPDSAHPAGELAAALGIPCYPVRLHRFPDGESLVQVRPEGAGGTAILLRSLDDPNAKLVEIVLAAAALRANGAGRVVLVAPYLAYMRQDMAFAPGQAVSQRVIGALLADHFDAVLTVDPHLHRIARLGEVMPRVEAVSITAAPALGACIDPAGRPVLVGPDSESRQWVEAIAAPLALDVLVGEKTRHGDRDVSLEIAGAEKLAGRLAILVDDVISSGRTLAVAAGILRAAGATRVEALATHCLAAQADLLALAQAGIDRIRSTDSIAGETATIPLAPLLARAIREHGWLEENT